VPLRVYPQTPQSEVPQTARRLLPLRALEQSCGYKFFGSFQIFAKMSIHVFGGQSQLFVIMAELMIFADAVF
jgi:hypothetical protein